MVVGWSDVRTIRWTRQSHPTQFMDFLLRDDAVSVACVTYWTTKLNHTAMVTQQKIHEFRWVARPHRPPSSWHHSIRLPCVRIDGADPLKIHVVKIILHHPNILASVFIQLCNLTISRRSTAAAGRSSFGAVAVRRSRHAGDTGNGAKPSFRRTNRWNQPRCRRSPRPTTVQRRDRQLRRRSVGFAFLSVVEICSSVRRKYSLFYYLEKLSIG